MEETIKRPTELLGRYGDTVLICPCREVLGIMDREGTFIVTRGRDRFRMSIPVPFNVTITCTCDRVWRFDSSGKMRLVE